MQKIYRGFSRKKEPGEYLNQFLLSPRQPTETPKLIHDFSDHWFYEKFGIKCRSTAVICTTEINQAMLYGSSGSILEIRPSGIYSIVYSPYVKDFLDIVTEIDEISFNAVSSWLENKNYQCVRSISEIEKSFFGEVMVSCEKYSAFTYI
ncbi:hypothetical protein F3J24_01890 [Comamonas sp. Tr-654]|uniref:hypothetical protein n=1 Tax=Comamonas sp. Tr-654 TaxID=2608341 RepID=UPI00141F5DC9|nr:hypothetical protein [Comamonas sp. Tr-654]NIF82263.1 hypothetical protein [Comamonas sp. Tr-654]